MDSLLMLLFIILFILSYCFLDGNILAPTNLYFIGCIISVVAMIYGNTVWNEEFSIMTFAVYATGGITFFLTSILYRTFYKKKIQIQKSSADTIKPILYSKEIMYLCILIQILTLVVYYIFMRNNVESGSLSIVLKMFRYAKKDGDISVPFLLGQFTKLSWAIATIEMYILVHNLTIKKSFKKEKKIILGILAFWLLQILQGSRVYILLSVLEGLFTFLIVRQGIYGAKKKLNIKQIIKIFVIVLLVMYGFIWIGQLMGRTASYTSDPLYYISMYAGSTMEIFNIYLKQGVSKITLLGHGTLYTFAGFDQVLSYIGLLRDKLPQTGAFVYLNGSAIGNICPGYFYWLYDFGMLGVIILTMIMSWFFNSLYRKTLKNFKIGAIQFRTLIFVSLNFALVMNGIADYLYRYILSMNYISMFAFCFLVIRFLFKIKLKKVDKGS